MKIESIETSLHRIPLPRPVGNAYFTYTHFEYVTATVTSEGARGFGWSYTLGTGGGAVKSLLDELAPGLIGADGRPIGEIHERLTRSTIPLAGLVSSLAIAPLDIALWDLNARVLNVSLAQMLGTQRAEIRACATGIDLNLTQLELADQVAGWVARGYRLIKVKVGKPTVDEDVSRLEAVRAAVGTHVELMVDANEAWTTREALRRIDAFSHINISCLEDPLPLTDVDGYRQLREDGRIPIAGGERFPSLPAAKTLLNGGVDILRADVCRLSGITQWLDVARLANSLGVAVQPHMVEDLSLPLTCVIDNAHSVEHVPNCNLLVAGLIHDSRPITAGKIAPREGVGHGVSFDQKVLDKYRTAEGSNRESVNTNPEIRSVYGN